MTWTRIGWLAPPLLVLAFFADVWGAGRVFAAGDILVHLPLRAALGRIAQDPSLFLWNPRLFAGYPTFADLNATPYYPFGTPWFLALSPARAYVAATISQYVLAAIFTYAFLRRIDVGRIAAVLGALAFALGTPMIAQLQHIKIVGSAAWMPLAFLAVEDAIRGRLRGAGWKAVVATTFLWIGGDPQIAVYVGCAAALYCLVRAVQERQFTRVGWLAFFAACGTAMAAVQILPMHELSAQSDRLGRPTVEFALTGSLPPWRLAGFFVPYLFGGPKWGLHDWGDDINFLEGSSYVGLVTLGLAALALVDRDRRGAAFLAVVALSLFLALGRYNPIAKLIFAEPPFLFFRVPARWTIPCSFALASLAAIGCDRLFALERARAWQRVLRLAAYGFVAAVGLALALNVVVFAFADVPQQLGEWWVTTTRLGRPGAQSMEWYRQALAERWVPSIRASAWILGPVMGLPIVFAGAALGALAVAPRLGPAAGGALLCALLAADLWVQNHGLEINATTSVAALEEPPAVGEFLVAARLGGHRVYSWWGGGGTGLGETGDALGREFDAGNYERWLRAYKEMLPMDSAALWDLPLFNAHSPTWLAHQERAFDEIEGAHPKRIAWEERYRRLETTLPLLRASSIRYILSPVALEFPGLVERYRTASLGGAHVVRVYEVSEPVDSAHWVPRLRPVASEDALWSELASAAFDGRAEALSVAETASDESLGTVGRVTMIGERPISRAYRVHADESGVLVVNQSHYPGWSASVDDRPAPILRVNGMFQGIAVPAGESVVRLSFRPRSLVLGASIALVGAIAAIVGIALAPRGPRG